MKLSFQTLKTYKGSKAENECRGHDKSHNYWFSEHVCNFDSYDIDLILTFMNLG